MNISESDDLLFTLEHGEPVCPDGNYPYELGADRAYWYARFIINERWPEAEPTIMTSPQYAYFYARIIIKARWPAAEPTIMASATWAFHYVVYIIKARWPEAESAIKRHETFWKWYKDEYL